MPDTTTYAVYGVRLRTEHRFANALPAVEGSADVCFRCTRERPPHAAAFAEEAPLATLGRLADGRPFQTVQRAGALDRIRYTEVADFYVGDREIVCWLRDPEFAFVVEIYLLGFVLSYWLERFRRTPALHAAAVVMEGRAVGFLATNKGGKTSLAASLMQAGHPLLTDDILAVGPTATGFAGHAGYPQMRMWPDQARHFLGGISGLERVHPDLTKLRIPVGDRGLGRFHAASAPLAMLYVPDRRDADPVASVEITPLAGTDAILTMIGDSFVARVLDAIGAQAERLGTLASLARAVPVRRLSYPSGMSRLPDVVRAVEADVGSAAPGPPGVRG